MIGSKILLVGNCVLDQIWELDHFPQQDEESRVLAKTRVLGGNACNTAQILAGLGNEVELVSSFAKDTTATWLLQELTSKNISTRYCIQKPGFSSAESSIWLNRENGSRTIVHHRDLPELTIPELKKIPFQLFKWIHFEGRNIDTLQSFLPDMTIGDFMISLEIEKQREGIEQLLPFVNTVIVSSAYLKSKNISANQCLRELTTINPNLNIVCTLGDSGLLGQDSQGTLIKLQAEKIEKVVDTIGAGDCFIGGLIHRLNQNDDFESALKFANHLAAQKIQFKGMRFESK